MYLAEENWGPIITGDNFEKTKKLFLESLSAGVIVQNVMNIDYAFKNEKLGAEYVKTILEESEHSISNLEFNPPSYSPSASYC